jgi:hypothetical protein
VEVEVCFGEMGGRMSTLHLASLFLFPSLVLVLVPVPVPVLVVSRIGDGELSLLCLRG